MQEVEVIRKLSKLIPQNSIITICKSFVRSHLNYGDFLLYDQPDNESLCQKIESVQYIAALAITGTIKNIYQMKLYDELGLESSSLGVGLENFVSF